MSGKPAPLTPEQIHARERWAARWNLPILVAAFVPLIVTSPQKIWIEVLIGFGSWIIFVVDLVVQRRIAPDYLRRRNGRIDLAIVLLTFPYYLFPGVSNGTALLALARLGRVARVMMATKGLRRLAMRLGKVAIVAALVVTICSLAAYGAEHPQNQGFATVGDAFWWGIVTLTTVGYGDIVPKTTMGRLCGVAIMFTGIAVLGVLAGSLAALFHLDEPTADEPADIAAGEQPPIHAELAALRNQLHAIDSALATLEERARADVAGASEQQ